MEGSERGEKGRKEEEGDGEGRRRKIAENG